MKTRALATKLPSDVADALDAVCKQTGLRKNFILAAALRGKIEDLQDAYDLREGIREATGFHGWEAVKRGARKRRRA